MSQQKYVPVNPHFLQHVLDLSAVHTIEAAEDIFNEKGIKLLAKGARISHHVEDRLVQHKLQKPLEQTLNIADAETKGRWDGVIDAVQSDAIFSSMLAHDLQDILAHVLAQDAPGFRMLFTVLQEKRPDALMHALRTAALSADMAERMGLGRVEQSAAIVSGMMHEVGLLYLAPEVNQAGADDSQTCSVQTMRQLAAHPLLGGLALRQLEGLPVAAVLGVEQQFERADGSGYPKRLSQAQLSPVGMVVGTASLICQLLQQQDWGWMQAQHALNFSPREFPESIKQQAGALLRLAQPSAQDPLWAQLQVMVEQELPALFLWLGQVQAQLAELEEQARSHDETSQRLLESLRRAFVHIMRMFSSTGIDALQHVHGLAQVMDSPVIQLEMLAVSQEIRRRLHDLGRIGCLQLVHLSARAQDAWVPWLELLIRSHRAPPKPETGVNA